MHSLSNSEVIDLIDNAVWIVDEYKALNLLVKDTDGRMVHCFLQQRPDYCDRGHISLNIDGPLDLDGADSFPRYFFSFDEADKHTRMFLKWRLAKHREVCGKLPLYSRGKVVNPQL